MEMKLTQKPLESYIQTVKEVFRLSNKYFKDLLEFNKNGKPIASFEPIEFFKYVQDCEYVKDPPGIEFVNRPKISLLLAGSGHPFDCDDRTILSLAYFKLRNYTQKLLGRDELFDYRVLVVGKTDRPHHIYIEFKNKADSNWIPFDPTYPYNVFGVTPFTPGFIKIFYENDL